MFTPDTSSYYRGHPAQASFKTACQLAVICSGGCLLLPESLRPEACPGPVCQGLNSGGSGSCTTRSPCGRRPPQSLLVQRAPRRQQLHLGTSPCHTLLATCCQTQMRPVQGSAGPQALRPSQSSSAAPQAQSSVPKQASQVWRGMPRPGHEQPCIPGSSAAAPGRDQAQAQAASEQRLARQSLQPTMNSWQVRCSADSSGKLCVHAGPVLKFGAARGTCRLVDQWACLPALSAGTPSTGAGKGGIIML